MGSLAAHIAAAVLLLLPAGLRRLYSSAAHHLRSPSPSTSLPWYLSHSKPLNVDLFALLLLLPLSSFSYLFLSLSTLRLPLLHHSALLFLFWLLPLLVALRRHLPLPPSLLFLLAAAAFLLDSAAASSSSSGYAGVAARVYRLLAATTLACAAACLALAARPAAFFADVALSAGLVLKGTWVLQAGLLLFSDAFAPRGCGRMAADGDRDVACVLEEDRMRGVAMVDLLFVVHVVGVVVVVLGVLWLHRGLGRGNGLASMAGEGQSDGALMQSEPEFQVD